MTCSTLLIYVRPIAFSSALTTLGRRSNGEFVYIFRFTSTVCPHLITHLRVNPRLIQKTRMGAVDDLEADPLEFDRFELRAEMAPPTVVSGRGVLPLSDTDTA